MASRVPSCSNKWSGTAKGSVLDHVSQIRDTVLMSVYLEVRNLGGSGFWNKGANEQGQGNGEFSLQAIGDRGGRILSQLGGFQVSGKGNKGNKGSKGSKGVSKEKREKQGNVPCTHVYTICVHVHYECLCE
jgi:hypothetical protein